MSDQEKTAGMRASPKPAQKKGMPGVTQKPVPEMLGSGMAATAATDLQIRKSKIAEELKKAGAE